MIIDGIEIPDEKLIEAGWAPPIPEPLQFDGTPVWAWVGKTWVGKNEDEYKKKVERQVIAHGEHYVAMCGDDENTNSNDVLIWRFAWAIPDGEK